MVSCIVSLLYSAGLIRSEVLNLKPEDIDGKRMVIKVRSGKGNKDRYTILSEKLLIDLRHYFQQWLPKGLLFEGPNGNPYSAESVLKIVKEAARKAGIRKTGNCAYFPLRRIFWRVVQTFGIGAIRS